ncbi:MAG: glycosyltransferase family 9 protein [Nitrospirae bacterium]|nr:glycosyltransferase family 9 protein [Nitrospirota bacterium]NTW65994.1 glycosyltransferase family 9 protein [Nitrospirota bacterium]
MFRQIKEKRRIIRRLLAQVYLPVLDTIFLSVVKGNPSTVRSELLVVRLDGIGDFVLWLDAAKELRTLYPREQYRITLLGNKLWTELAAELPYFDEVWSLDKEKFEVNIAYRMKTLLNVRNAGFDTVIQPMFSREFLFGDTLVRASWARHKIGFQSDDSNISSWQRRISDRWYTRLISASREPLMELERNAEFIRGLGLPGFKAYGPTLQELHHRLPKDFCLKDYYILFPGTGLDLKKWPLSRFKELAERLYNATGWTGVVCGGPGEYALGQTIKVQSRAPIENWAGRTSLRELIGIIENGRILIGNDTSAIHIAVAVSTTSVSIVGGGHFGRFFPYKVEEKGTTSLPEAVYHVMDCFNCNWRCIYPLTSDGIVKCIDLVSVDSVWQKIEGLLREQKR